MILVANDAGIIADNAIGDGDIGRTGAPTRSTGMGIGVEMCVNGSPDAGTCVDVRSCPGCGSSLFANDCSVDAVADSSFAAAVCLTGMGGVDGCGVVENDSCTGEAIVRSCSWGAGVASGVGITVARGAIIKSLMGVDFRVCNRDRDLR